ncbi:IS66 family transposase [Bradyrhizobium australiense]|uniref:Transposase n=1 Tax=Bradyrhizobium australiense TaxID=2721161 RepID=A0A7Y4GYW9_9BRAD|nr:transposase [Bradyrhizobium australiense]NOJ44556.1 transposase [Bradyrhizobium australiense]
MAVPVRQSCCSAMPPAAGAFAQQFLLGLKDDSYSATAMRRYDRLTRIERPQRPWTLVHCWSHLRRRFVKLMRNTKSPIAEAAVKQIASLHAIEATVRGASPQARLVARKTYSAPIVDALKP